jgi:hypothetical protein
MSISAPNKQATTIISSKADLTFPNRGMAFDFAKRWTSYTLTVYTISTTKEDGSVVVRVYNINSDKKAFIDSYIESLHSRLHRNYID